MVIILAVAFVIVIIAVAISSSNNTRTDNNEWEAVHKHPVGSWREENGPGSFTIYDVTVQSARKLT